jgi:hypothetical protein
MAEITLLTPEQVAEREQKPKGHGRSGRRRSPARTRIIEEYKAVMQDVAPGYGADVLLGEDEDKRFVRQNLKAAADELNVALEFRPIKDKRRIHFRFITPEERAAKPKRGGRPRKHGQAVSVEADGAREQAHDAAHERPPVVQEAPAETPKQRTRSRRAVASEAPSS